MNRRSRGGIQKPFVSGGSLYKNETIYSNPMVRRDLNHHNEVYEPQKPIQVVAQQQQAQQQQQSPAPQRASPQISQPPQVNTPQKPPAPPAPQMNSIQQQQQLQQQQQQQQQIQQQLQQKLQQQVSSQMEDESALNESDGDNTGDHPGTKGFFKKMFKNRKKPSVRAKEKKMRQSRLIRRVLIPKNALMALHEVKNIKIDDFQINSNQGGGFTAIVQVNNVQYEGIGSSKNAAKSNVCEKALRDLVLAKMTTNKSRSSSMENVNDVEMKDVNEQEGEEDDIPILNLASFALYKLFAEWESEGYEVPEFRPTNNPAGQPSADGAAAANGTGEPKEPKPKKPPTVRNDLPKDWETMHPATLLCMMRPGLTYVDLGAEGKPGNQMQKAGVTVDENHFIGTGKSKKVARKNAAAQACNALFKCSFPNFNN